MKYVLSMKIKDPIVENWKKIQALSEQRGQKGVGIGEPEVLSWHYALTESKGLAVVEKDDPDIILKWLTDFAPYATVKAIPLIDAKHYQGKYPGSP